MPHSLPFSVLGIALVWSSSAEAQSCKRYVRGCKAPEFIESAWSTPKPWWVAEIPGILADMDERSRSIWWRLNVEHGTVSERIAEMTAMERVRPTGGVQNAGCVFVGNRWIGWRLEFPHEVQGC